MSTASSSRLIRDEGSCVIAVEESNPDGTAQALWVRAGRVYDAGKLRDQPGLWVHYQEDYMRATLDGPVLITPAVWRLLVKETNARLRKQKRYLRRERRRERKTSGR